jgi:glycosyl transferase family 87
MVTSERMEGTVSPSGPASLPLGVRRVLDVLFFGLIPLLPFLPVAAQAVLRRKYIADGWFFDVHWLWVGWGHVAHGQNPYVDFLYPPPAAVLPAPLGFLGYRPAVIVWLLILVASIVLALRVLGVRDWRCYSLALLAMPAFSSIRIGTPTPLLMLAAACAWRYRDRRWAAAGAVAFAIGFKIFLWPLLIWLAVRRFRTAVSAVVVTAALVIGCWAVIGFAGATGSNSYGHRLVGTESIDQYRGYSVIALAHRAGLGGHGSRAVGVLAALAALAAIIFVGRRAGGDRNAFIAALAASLLASPVVWGHYFLLALIPLALARQQVGLAWLAPLAFWVIPQQENLGSIVPVVVGLGIFLALIAWSARDADRFHPLSHARAAPGGLP